MEQKIRFIALCFLILVGCTAQAVELPDAPSHRFWDQRNVKLHTFNLAGNTLDAVTTQHFLSNKKGVELNPMARPFVVKGWSGQVFCSYGWGVGGPLLASYIAHRTGHHRIERLIPMITGGAMMGVGAANLRFW